MHLFALRCLLLTKKNNSLLTYTGCFSCTMEGGFRIYNVEPLSEKARVGESLIITNGYNTYYLKHKHSNKMIILKGSIPLQRMKGK